jgi:uncharacterized repeat protein (TIGR03837 family)
MTDITIFCKVIDNFGDIGVCWRLARQLAHEHGKKVELWIDDMATFARIAPQVNTAVAAQDVEGIAIRHWPEPYEGGATLGSIVIEAFACGLPEEVMVAMAAMKKPPACFNLEYLSAEAWVTGCHMRPSPHPVLPITTHFYFPGFTLETGGLLREQDLFTRRDVFDAKVWANERHLPEKGPDEIWFSLFCYPNAAIAAWLDTLAVGTKPVRVLVPEGVASKAVAAYAGAELSAGATFAKGKLKLHGIPFVPQAEYDELLWAVDINLVRGEDSLVRAIWAGKPFLWQIYPQEGGVHLQKLKAFMGLYGEGLSPTSRAALDFAHTVWNKSAGSAPEAVTGLLAVREELAAHAKKWAAELAQQPDLVSRLLKAAANV